MKIKSCRQEILFFSIFVLLTLAATYPIIFRMSSSIYGLLYGTDIEGQIWHLWWLKYAWQHSLPEEFIHIIASPFGVDSSLIPSFPVWMWLSKWTSILTNEIFVYNLTIILSFVLSAITMYFLVYYLTRNKLASMVSGIIYAFSPYHFNRTWEHLSLANIQWMPLYVLALMKLAQKGTLKFAILCGIAFWLVISFDYSYAYIMSIFTLGFLLFCFGYRWRRKWHLVFSGQWTGLKEEIKPALRSLKMVVVAILIGIILASPALYPIFKTVVFSPKTEAVAAAGYLRPFKELFAYSARPLSYLLPSREHPLFGSWVEPFIGSIFYGRGTIEHTLYLGYVPLILAFVAYRRWKGQRRKFRVSPPHSLRVPRRGVPSSSRESSEFGVLTENNFVVGLFIFSASVALVFSMSPYWRIGNFRLYFPSFFMYKIFPMFRSYARFGVVVMLSVAVLTGIGASGLLGRMTRPWRRRTFIMLVLLLVGFEFNNIPPFRVTDISNPPSVYRWLAAQPGEVTIAEYPFGDVSTHQGYLFYQRVHQKNLINGAYQGTHAYKVRQKVIKLMDPETPGILSYLGAKYVVVHLDRYKESELGVDIVGQIPDFSKQPGLKLVRRFDNVEVYEVKAEPIEPKAD